MIKCIKDSFRYTNKYLILATPLILFSLVAEIYLAFSLHGNALSMFFAVIIFFMMLAVFISGWFYMITVMLKDDNREEPNSLVNEFTAGVGEYFLSAMGMIFNVIIISILVLLLSYFVGMKFIGNAGISAQAFSKAMESAIALKAFLASLSSEQLLKLNLWNLLIMFGMSLVYFIIMFYVPALLFKKKNPFVALFVAIKDLFSRKFIKNVALYIFIFSVYAVISILMTISGKNILFHFIMILVHFYYVVFASVLAFDFYYTNYVKIGSNIDTVV